MTWGCSLGCKIEPVLFCLLIGISLSSVSFPSLLVGDLQRNRTNMMCVSRQIYYKELAHSLYSIMEAGKSRICRVGRQAKGPGKQMFWFEPKGSPWYRWSPKTICWIILSCSLFVLFKPSTDRRRFTHVVVGNCLPSNFTDLHESQPKMPSQKHPE